MAAKTGIAKVPTTARAPVSYRLLFRCLARWGPLHGARIWWTLDRCARGIKGSAARQLAVPGYRHPIWLRPGTSDVAVFERNILRDALDGSAYPQNGPLAARADLLGDKAIIVDGGANIGLSAVWFANAYPKARILAVEPSSNNLEILRRNTAPYPSIEPVEGALWNRPAQLRIVNPRTAAWSYRVGDANDRPPDEPVAAFGINDLIARAGGGELLIVKLIVEGAEKTIFRDNLEWLDQASLVILMPSDWADPGGGAGRTAMAALSRQPFDWIIRDLCVFCYRVRGGVAGSGEES